jgi:hypothetical protein
VFDHGSGISGIKRHEIEVCQALEVISNIPISDALHPERPAAQD